MVLIKHLSKAGISARLAGARLGIRLYHSPDHPSSNLIINPATIESKILTNALQYIPTYGFTSYCVTKSIHELKFPDSTHSVLTSLPTGGSLEFQLMHFWLKFQREKLNTYIIENQELLSKLTQYERISHLINKRLEFNQPVISKLTHGISQLAIPYNLPQSLEELHNLSDDIAFYAGDKSNDFAWYTKRGGISSIYVSSELYMLQDTSLNFKNTREFVNNKVQGLSDLGGAYNDVEQWGFSMPLV